MLLLNDSIWLKKLAHILVDVFLEFNGWQPLFWTLWRLLLFLDHHCLNMLQLGAVVLSYFQVWAA